MPKLFDATLNALIDAHLADWAAFLAARVCVPSGRATPLDTDLSATLQADRLFRVDAEVPYALHLELESTGRLGIPYQLLRYNVAAHGTCGLPIHSVLVLLRPKANASDLTGTFEMPGADGRTYLTFRYTVIRVWQETLDGLLSAGLGFAPLALLTNEAAADLPGAFDRLRERLRPPAASDKLEQDLLGSTMWLVGLRYGESQIAELYRRVSMINLEDSSTYHWVKGLGRKEGLAIGKAEGKAEGKVEGEASAMRALILQIGAKRFRSSPSKPLQIALEGIADLDRLRRIVDRILDASGWDELLAQE